MQLPLTKLDPNRPTEFVLMWALWITVYLTSCIVPVFLKRVLRDESRPAVVRIAVATLGLITVVSIATVLSANAGVVTGSVLGFGHGLRLISRSSIKRTASARPRRGGMSLPEEAGASKPDCVERRSLRREAFGLAIAYCALLCIWLGTQVSETIDRPSSTLFVGLGAFFLGSFLVRRYTSKWPVSE